MTTQEELHLALAERLPELRLTLLEAYRQPVDYSDAEIERGWVPNVTTDALLEALRAQGWHNVVFTFGSVVICWLDKSPAITHRHSSADTIHEALCRAALKALEI